MHGFAQTSPQPASAKSAESDVIELSPFTVTADDDTGYRAKTALEGGRMRTNLADISNPIDVITAEMISDMGATGLDSLFTVINSIEIPADMVFNTTYDTGNMYQARGFGANVTTRNFAPGTTPFDAYNTTRLTAAMGPNAILFGNGPSGGSLGYSTKRPNLDGRDRKEGQLRTDSHGSLRGTLSMDQTLIKGKLGLHLDYLQEDARYAIKPSYHRKNGVTLSAGWRPFKHTSVNVSFERVQPRGSVR